MEDFSDFDFKGKLQVFRVVVDGLTLADVPLGSLEHFLLCVLHASNNVVINVNLRSEVL